MRGLLFFAALVCLGLASASCGGESGSTSNGAGGSGSGDTSTPAGFCSGTFGAVVHYMEDHCSAADKKSDSYLFVWGFLSAAVQECTVAITKGIEAGRVSLDAQAAKECTDGYSQALAASSGFSIEDSSIAEAVKEACKNALVGKQATGAPCKQSFECENGATCVGFTPDADGTCQKPAIGETCGQGESSSGELTFTFSFGDHPECVNGFCDSVYENSEFVDRCVAFGAAGEECSDTDECQSGLRCQLGKCTTEGPAQAGGACQSFDDCDDGLYCPNDTNVCTAKKKTGETCDPGIFGGNECEGTCSAPEGAESGTCASFCGAG